MSTTVDYDLITEYTSQSYTPAARVPATFGRQRTIDSITIHWWGLPAWLQTFMGVLTYLLRPNGTSAHYVIKGRRVACIVDPDDAAWANGSAHGNATSISIEMSPHATAEDYATLAQLILELRAVYGNVPLKRHSDWTATSCPGVWSLSKIEATIDNLQDGGLVLTGDVKPIKPAPEPATSFRKTGNRLTLPASATAWNVYPLNRRPVVGNESGQLNPSLFGGIVYEIYTSKLEHADPDVMTIKTRDFGYVNIYTAPSTGAKVSSGKAAPKPTPPAKQYITLPAVDQWGIYPQGVAPVAANIFHYLTPAAFGGLTYEVKGWTVADQVALIDTGVKGRVQIYVAKGTGAKITGTAPAAPKPAPEPAKQAPKSSTGFYAYLGHTATSWNIYKPGVAPVAGNQFMELNPRARADQRKYPFIKWTDIQNVALISTTSGPMQIYIGKETGGYVGR